MRNNWLFFTNLDVNGGYQYFPTDPNLSQGFGAQFLSQFGSLVDVSLYHSNHFITSGSFALQETLSCFSKFVGTFFIWSSTRSNFNLFRRLSRNSRGSTQKNNPSSAQIKHSVSSRQKPSRLHFGSGSDDGSGLPVFVTKFAASALSFLWKQVQNNQALPVLSLAAAFIPPFDNLSSKVLVNSIPMEDHIERISEPPEDAYRGCHSFAISNIAWERDAIEPKTGIKFPTILDSTFGGEDCSHLTTEILVGTGSRSMRVIKIKTLKVYAFGLYVQPDSVCEKLGPKYANMSIDELENRSDFFEDLLREDIHMTVRLVVTHPHPLLSYLAMEPRMTPTLASLLLISASLLPLPSAFSPTSSLFLTCGGSTPISLPNDNPPRPFVPDTPYLSSDSDSDSKSISDPSPASSPSLYSTARLFTTPATYTFNQLTAPGAYILRLHFSPFPSPYNLAAASFSVSAPGRFLLLDNFSVSTASSPTWPLIIKEYLLSVDTGSLTLTFTPNSLQAAFINAIELFNAPSNLIDGASPTYIGSGNHRTDPLPDQGMETLYRVNVGGPLVTPANDTLWRTWVPDAPYMFDSTLSFENSTSPELVVYRAGNDTRRTPEIAPPSVYCTARIMAVTPILSKQNFNFNLTWTFRVSPAKSYFIRMHFCNFMFPVTQLLFDVYVGQLQAYGDLQPSTFDPTPAAAFYLDFAADSDASGLLNVSVGPSNRSSPTTANALLNGLEIMKLGLDSDAAIGGKNGGVSMKILIPSVICAILILLILILAAVLTRRRHRPKTAAQPKSSPATPNGSPSGATAPPRSDFGLQIHFEEIRFATDNFDEKLVIGSGGFGKVYKGVMRDGTRVAVKRGMPGSGQGHPEFQTEIEVLSRIRHRHLVSLIGYCDDGSEMILVYEYMESGALKDYLYGSSGSLPSCLTWKQRLEICIGAARGLHYLHTGYSHNIIHRDVKSTNILLGEDYLAKVADFGLSRLGPSVGETHVSTRVKGTFGYLDPEYFKVQKLTDKSDVYSFGVMLFEVLCARPVIDPSLSREQMNLAEWGLMWQRRGKLEKIVDPRLVGRINANSLRKFGETAAKCLADYGIDRPAMGDVLWNLEYALRLQETEVRREAFEDSGNVESQVPVNVTMRRLPSSSVSIGGDEGEDEWSKNGGQSGVSASTVFSQLFTGDGR